MSKEHKYYPYPEFIDGGKWDIKAGDITGSDVKPNARGTGGMISVPLDSSDASRYLRFREQAHITLSPRVIRGKPDDLPDWVLEAAKEARLTKRVYQSSNYAEKRRFFGFPVKTQSLTEVESAYLAHKALEADDDLPMGALFMQYSSTDDSAFLLKEMRKVAGAKELECHYDEDDEFTLPPAEIGRKERQVLRVDSTYNLVNEIAYKYIGSRDPASLSNFKKTALEAAKELHKKLHGFNKADEEEEKQPGKKDPGETDEFEELLKETEQNHERIEREAERRHRAYGNSKDAVWAQLEVVNMPMNRRLSAKIREDRYRSADRGHIPHNMHRWCSDKQVFRTRRRFYGGTVLIDQSGSMSFEHEEIMRILELIPAGIVAAYSGHSDVNDAGYAYGSLRILAKNGWAIPDYVNTERLPDGRMTGYSNLVDGPALEWLAKQKAPRYWVSDGMVTGCQGPHNPGDVWAKHLANESIHICRKNRIVRLDHMEGIEEALKKGRIKV